MLTCCQLTTYGFNGAVFDTMSYKACFLINGEEDGYAKQNDDRVKHNRDCGRVNDDNLVRDLYSKFLLYVYRKSRHAITVWPV